MPVDFSGIHPILQAAFEISQRNERDKQHKVTNELNQKKFEEEQKQNVETLKIAKDRLKLAEEEQKLQNKLHLWQAEQTIRGQYASGIRTMDYAQEGGPLKTPITSQVVDSPLGQIGLSGLVGRQDIVNNDVQAYKAMTEPTVDRTQQLAQVKSQAQLPAQILKYKEALDLEKLRGTNRLDVADKNAEASKYRADSSFAARIRSAGISAAAHQGAAKNQTGVNRFLSMHDTNPITRRYTVGQEALSFVNSLPNDTKNPADDQGLVYSFAKAMDPDSVVREGEYNTVQKYSQSWLDKFKFNAKRVLNNSEFLTPEARTFMKQTIASKADAASKVYSSYRKSIEHRIDMTTGQQGYGNNILGDVFRADTPAAPAANAAPTEAVDFDFVNGKLVKRGK